MGNKLMKGILRRACAVMTAIAAAAAPVMVSGGGAFADTKDYDQEIAELEQKAERIKAQNEERQQQIGNCLLYTSPSPRDRSVSRMPSSA